ncbi:acyl carrier protein, partial [Frankia sp. AiPs1]|uniref:acyl carrier protein n=1 Tax=Frankia sp. AiPs1 TaxID=573493 RepID=UPI0020431E3F
MLRQDEFEQLIAQKLGLADSAIAGGSRLHEDLGLDSFRLLELCLYVIELGVDLSEANWLEIETVGELYNRYRAGPPAAAPPPPPAELPSDAWTQLRQGFQSLLDISTAD